MCLLFILKEEKDPNELIGSFIDMLFWQDIYYARTNCCETYLNKSFDLPTLTAHCLHSVRFAYVRATDEYTLVCTCEIDINRYSICRSWTTNEASHIHFLRLFKKNLIDLRKVCLRYQCDFIELKINRNCFRTDG